MPVADARVLLAFAAFLALAVFFARLGVSSALAPLCAVGGGALWMTLWGCFGLLRLGGWLFYAGALLAGAFLAVSLFAHKKPLPVLGAGFWFFTLAGLLVLVLLWVKQPLFTEWDEFSLWGTAAKLTKLNDELYVTAPVGWKWTATQKPAAMLPGYLVQFFGGGFAEWQTYAGVDLLLLAMMAAVLRPLDERRDAKTAFPLAVLLLLVPFVFYHYENATQISPAYLDSLGDMPLGLAFAAALAAHFGAARQSRADAAAVWVALGVLTLTKDTGFALALVACVLVFADRLLAAGPGDAEVGLGVGKREPAAGKNACIAEAGAGAAETGPDAVETGAAARPVRRAARLRARLGPALLCLALCLASVVAAFGGWEAYLGLAAGASRTEAAGSTAAMGIQEMPFAFAADLLSPVKSDFFRMVTGGMVRFFWAARGNMLGSGLVLTLLVWAVLAASALLWRHRPHQKRCLWYGVLSSLGFIPWYALITMSYLYVLRPEQAFESYDRYVFPYYIGWLLGALVLLARGVLHAPRAGALLGRLGLCAAALLVLARVGMLVPAQYTLLGAPGGEYALRRAFSARVQALQKRLDPAGRTFLVMSEDLGLGWFMYCYEMLPWQMDYSYGGEMLDSFAVDGAEEGEEAKTEKRAPTIEEWARYLEESGCTTVYVDYADEQFIETYGALFQDGMQGYRSGRTSLYAVDTAAGGLALRPVTQPAEGGA